MDIEYTLEMYSNILDLHHEFTWEDWLNTIEHEADGQEWTQAGNSLGHSFPTSESIADNIPKHKHRNCSHHWYQEGG